MAPQSEVEKKALADMIADFLSATGRNPPQAQSVTDDTAVQEDTNTSKKPKSHNDKESKRDKKAKKAKRSDEVDTTPPGMTCELKNVYQKMDKQNKAVWVNDYPDDLDEPVENKETAKFALIVRNKKSYDTRKKLEIDSIIVQSPLLKASLEPVLKDYPGITINLERLTFKAPFQPFVHRWERFVETLAFTPEGSEAYQHLQLLYTILEAELKDLIHTKEDHVANGVITYEHLWTIFEPGALIYSFQDGYDRVSQLAATTNISEDRERGVTFIGVRACAIDFDGTKFGTRQETLRNYEFGGTMKITNLAAYPLAFHPDKKVLIKKLLERGNLFEKYAGYHYMAYKGIALGYGRCGMIKHSVDSRIIIDTEAHNKFLPNYALAVGQLNKPVSLSSDDAPASDDDDDEYNEDEDEDYIDGEGSGTSDSLSDDIDTPDTDESNAAKGVAAPRRRLTDRELLLTVPYVRGYALKSKTWLWFFLPHIIPIKFNTSAFSSLVLPPQQKDLILAFVESQIRQRTHSLADQADAAPAFDDIIAGKGRGMILLLSGPPGVGKTLTAESVAENLRVPLYMMSAGDLGLEPSSIENSLNTILEMVTKWSAVLLLDEADVFLEARTSVGGDLERNKMVSIFLRVLEYYEGILFLTTNRIRNIDDAFHSRIHISMQYPALDRESRKHIWKTFAERQGKAGVDLADADIDELSEVEINGRQIKNVLKTAGMLAARKGGRGVVGVGEVRTVMQVGVGVRGGQLA